MQVLVALLVLKTCAAVLLTFPQYFPADFRADFLLGRESYFFGSYQWAFYPHILAGPFCLVLGSLLLSDSMRRRLPAWHRRLGRVQVVAVLLLVAPSGLWMARYAATGTVAGVGFATLALATAFAAAAGWRMALVRRFDQHRLWMQRCYLLLCAAVVVRVVGGFAETVGIDGTYPYAAWLSWLVPLAVFESLRISRRSARTRQSLAWRDAVLGPGPPAESRCDRPKTGRG
ncbi:MAG: DUF2306 domain-containing protein [Planctomycetales bacterium]|nr:DUF2306 domain-containing protein [Planctomycetales bacterium]